MISGGVDSVALLANILANTSWEVYAHHIEIVKHENRREAENHSMRQIQLFLHQNYRDFEYTVSKFEFDIEDKFVAKDLTTSLFVAAQITKSMRYTRHFILDIVATGHLNATPEAEFLEGSSVFNSCFMNYTKKPIWVRPLIQKGKTAAQNKIDIYESIPKELVDISWSCRTPKFKNGKAIACNACKIRNNTVKKWLHVMKVIRLILAL